MCSWLVLLAVTAASLLQGCGGTFTSGFPSLDVIRGNGSLLNDGVYSTHDGEIRSVPSVEFTCNGNWRITKFTFIALPRVGDHHTEFVVVGPGNSERRISTEGATQSFGEFGYELSVPETGSDMLQFQDGDTLEIDHYWYGNSSLRILHQVGDEELAICWRWRSEGSMIYRVTDYDYPLVAIETVPPGCVQGLVTESELRNMWEDRTRPILYYSPAREIEFSCDGSVSRILVGAYITDSGRLTGDLGPTIHIYESGTDSTDTDSAPLHTCDLTTLSATEHLNVYECEVSPPVDVNEGDYMLIRQRNRTSQICFLHDGQTDTPLISVDVDGACADSSGFIDLPELMDNALSIPNFAEVENEEDVLLMFNSLIITQNGYLVKWTFIAEDLGQEDGRTQFPGLVIGNDGLISGEDAVSTNYSNVYEYTAPSSIPVQAGNIITVQLPPESSARLLLSFVRNAGPPGIDLIIPIGRRKRDIDPVSGREGNLPLITLEIRGASTSPVGPSPSTPATITPSSTPVNQAPFPPTPAEPASPPTATTTTTTPHPTTAPPPPDSQGSSDSTGAIVGAVLGLLLAAGVVTVLIVVLLLVLRKRKRYNVKEKAVDSSLTGPMDNPVYTGCDPAPGRQVEEPEYQVPSPAITDSSSRDRLYEVPDDIHDGGKKEKSQSFDNPGYHSTLQDVHSTTDQHTFPAATAMPSPNHYEMGIYVPTQEQRQCVGSFEEDTSDNIYATLGETQVREVGQKLSFFEECDVYWRPASTREDLYEQLALRKYREIPRHQIQITEHLGSGQFGTVNRGVWQGPAGVEVAVKMLQAGTSEEDTVRFLQEAAINGQFRHPNIVQLHGVVTVGKPVMIVLELVSNGDLRNYLLKHKPAPGELPPSDMAAMLCQFCVQVAKGMDYLSRKAFVHRDLAARNILVTQHKTCKISDFGMSRDLEEGTYYVSHGGKIPVKWTAPEALHYKKYSTASDVWSFGCLMYEIWSLGHKPFEGYTNPDTIKLIDSGCRLAPPPGCPQEMYRLMITCWNSDKSARPQFRETVESLSRPEDELIFIPEEVKGQAALLGAPLEAGRNLYTELQNTYIS